MSFSGCKGIGKTETLKNMCCTVPLYKPSIVPIFVTFKGDRHGPRRGLWA
jgi:hypothetical protein